jgi:hypothetical protein
MKIVPNERDMSLEDREKRRRLLATIHIAKKELRFTEEKYRRMLLSMFSVPTASALSNDQLWNFIRELMCDYRWAPQGCKRPEELEKREVEALHYRVLNFIPQMLGGEARVMGLCKAICGVDRIEWCTDTAKLKRLLAAMGNIKRKEEAKAGAETKKAVEMG